MLLTLVLGCAGPVQDVGATELDTGTDTAPALAPVLSLSANDSLDFGEVSIGCAAQQALVATNTGTLDLQINALSLQGSGAELQLELDPLPWTLQPGESRAFLAHYAPVDLGADARLLQVASDDPQHQNQTTLSGVGVGDWTVDRFEIPPTRAVDVLLAVDRSSSMLHDLPALSESFGALIAALERAGNDYQVAALTEADGCILGEPAVIDSSLSTVEQQAAFDTQICLDNDCGGAFNNGERAFMLFEAALSAGNTAGCNAGFLRPEARLLLVGISDEPEQSVESYTHYLSLFQSLKAEPWGVSVSGIGGPYPSGCTGAMAYTGVYEAAGASGGQIYSICEGFEAAMDALGESAVPTLDRFALSATPVPQSMQVRVDGVEQSLGWRYIKPENAVAFEAAHVPALGSVVEVGYAQLSDCD